VPVRRYTHSANVDEPLQVETFDTAGSFDARYTYHADHLGSIRYLTDGSGTIVNAYDYDSYGRPLFGITAFDQPFAYTGREWDAATGLYHFRARAYDAEMGRFLQEDPIGILVGFNHSVRYRYSLPKGQSISESLDGLTTIVFEPDFNLNIYRYVNNDPINLKDPLGLIGISYSKLVKKQSATLRAIDFRARKALRVWPVLGSNDQKKQDELLILEMGVL
jgi:RHS repeat-associated protein